MVFASHYIFQDLLNLQEKNVERLREVCEVYGRRYSEDEEFQDIASQIMLTINSKNNGDLDTLKSKLEELVTSRKLVASNGSTLR